MQLNSGALDHQIIHSTIMFESMLTCSPQQLHIANVLTVKLNIDQNLQNIPERVVFAV